MNDTTPPRRRPASSGRTLGRILGGLLLVGGGFGLAVFLVANPLELRALDALGHRLLGHGGAAPAAGADAGPKQLWTCGMHPQVIEDQPGLCPICKMQLTPMDAAPAPAAPKPGGRKVLFYRNPMNPTATSPVPMKDSMGMDYVPVYEDEVAGQGVVVSIDPAVVQNMGVVSEPVTRRDVTRRIRTVGYLGFDQEKMVSVTTKYNGFVEKVYVNYLGQPVKLGDPLFDVYAPELVQTEQELLSAIEFARRLEDAPEDVRRRATALVDAARTRLFYWDIAPEQVARLEQTGRVFRTLTVQAPVGGLVMKRLDGLEGMAVRPGMDVIHIADLSSLWLKVEAFEDQLAWLTPGSRATVSLTYFPGETFSARVHFIEPEVAEKTRTITLTLKVPNPDGRLRSGMYATVEFEPVVARDAVVVPSRAVLRTGKRNVIVVDLGQGRFAPREIGLGAQGEGWVQVLRGLEPGERVVVSSQFLIDSESNLQEAIQKMIAARTGHDH